jgi:hypothetical protein
MNIGIIQPGRLGDIILCLPIAKYYNDRGYNVIWPIFAAYTNMFSEVVNYVTFLPVNNNIYTGVTEAYQCVKDVDKIIDLAATFPGSKCTDAYVASGDGLGTIKADEFKYITSEVPIDEKWNLVLNRNKQKEEELFKLYVKQPNYVVACLTSSQGRINYKLDPGTAQLIEMNENHSIFHWIGILEGAKVLALSNSCVANLVEMLNISNKKFLLPRQDGRLPTLKNKWIVV